MANNDPPVRITGQAIRDYASSLEHAARLLRETSEAMEQNDIADLMVLNYKTGDQGHQKIIKFASYVHIAFGEKLANRSMELIRESRNDYKTSTGLEEIKTKAKRIAKTFPQTTD